MPTEEDIAKAVEQVKRELESPQMAQALKENEEYLASLGEKRPNPRSVRLGAEQNQIVERIIAQYSPPGFPLSYNAALKIALAFWAENNPA